MHRDLTIISIARYYIEVEARVLFLIYRDIYLPLLRAVQPATGPNTVYGTARSRSVFRERNVIALDQIRDKAGRAYPLRIRMSRAINVFIMSKERILLLSSIICAT